MSKLHFYNNGSIEKKYSDDEIIPQGFVRGRLTTPWNKGLSKATNNILAETSSKISKACKGRIPYNKGSKMPEDQKLKQSETMLSKYASGELITWNKGLTKDTNESMMKISEAQKGHPSRVSEESILKGFATRKKHGTSNCSKKELEFGEELRKEYPNFHIHSQYADDPRYPYPCDYYIEELDLFIELNYHWTHGSHPFDPNCAEDIEMLEQWKHKAESSIYYKYAIETWTIRDVNKIKTAAQNNVNLKILYS